jgi:hypothetical protein
MEGVQIDHIIPRARGGPNVAWNKQVLHTACNVRKGDKLTPAAEALAASHGVKLHEPNGQVQRQLRSRRPYSTKPLVTDAEIAKTMRLPALPPSLVELQNAIGDVLYNTDGRPRRSRSGRR